MADDLVCLETLGYEEMARRRGGFFRTQVIVPKFRSLVQRPLSAFQTTFLRALVDSGIQGVQGQGVWTLMIVESVDQ